MSGSIFDFIKPKQAQTPNIVNLIKTIKSGNPDAIFRSMYNSNPQFKQFVDANRGNTPQQIASNYGVDYSIIHNILGGK